ncbi:hypothetical protein HYY75_11580, partial [bacterium]|nr:hypothetical protein [bacterium]
MKWRILPVSFFMLFVVANCFACSAQGPQDPVTGLISYPVSAGKGTVVPSIPGTVFAGGDFYKGWNGSTVKYMVVPVGTTIAFEGVIQGGTSRPPYWEEGAAGGLTGYVVSAAPAPTWTIAGNGRGDWRGQAPPAIGGNSRFMQFLYEGAADVVIPEDTPQVQTPNPKATWKLQYDKAEAVNVLLQAWDSGYSTLIQNALPSITRDMIQNAQDPQNDRGAKSYNETDNEYSAVKSGSVANLQADIRIA